MIKKKTAVIYDKWLTTLGGGEMVACNIARVLKDTGYEVIFISGKKVPVQQIKKVLSIDLSDIKFKEVWNDEIELQKIVRGKDLFINCSFMDYSRGYAKKNIYYTYFPTESYLNLKGRIFNEVILPIALKIIKPVEFIYDGPLITLKNNHLAYLVEEPIKLAFSYLSKGKTYLLKFLLFLENFYFYLLNEINYQITGAKIINKQIKINHYHNIVNFDIKIQPKTSTIYLEIIPPKNIKSPHLLEKDKLYLLYPKIIDLKIPNFFYKLIHKKIETRLRAGLFNNILERLNSYQIVLSCSEFVKKWIKIYWKKRAKVLYPPVNLLFEKYDLNKIKKENWICNLGRFFTLGHGKKQEVLIDAFKKFYKSGYKNWQLHLIGGVDKEATSINFIKYLKKNAKGYPIFFHLNVSRKKVEEILLKSKIYWHATGFGEKKPIKMEHFGIAPIEAISTGCIPVLYNGGGLKEIVKKLNLNEKISLFSSTNQLINNTKEFIKRKEEINPNIYSSLIKYFHFKSFKNQLINFINNNVKK